MFTNTAIGDDLATIREVVTGLEAAGFDGISLNDHVVGGHPDRAEGTRMHLYPTATREPLMLLSAIAALSTRLELATAILLLPQRQTTLVAKQVAELDVLSGGRVRLGVGIGRNWMEYEALNEDFTNRGRRLEEQIEVLRRFWTEDLVTFDGRWHQLDRVGVTPLPVQRPVPIWMGSFYGKVVEKVLERIGRMADGWLPQFPPDKMAPVLERIRGYAEAAGRNPDDLGIECVISATADDSPDRWADLAGAYRDQGATHLKVVTGQGFDSPQARLETMVAWRESVAPIVSP
jgi:probable F420-dependent oxidoreductase